MVFGKRLVVMINLGPAYAKEQWEERGATEEEVGIAISDGYRETAKYGRSGAECLFVMRCYKHPVPPGRNGFGGRALL
jgi:hypothetical protein